MILKSFIHFVIIKLFVPAFPEEIMRRELADFGHNSGDIWQLIGRRGKNWPKFLTQRNERIQIYSADLNTRIQIYSADLNKIIQIYSADLIKRIQIYTADLNKRIQIYSADLNKINF